MNIIVCFWIIQATAQEQTVLYFICKHLSSQLSWLFTLLCSSEMPWSFTDESSIKYIKGQCLTAKAKGLVWFDVFFLCLLPCLLVCLFPPALLLLFFLLNTFLSLWVWVSSLIVFLSGTVGRINCLSWTESGDIRLRTHSDCFEWYSV